MTNDDEMTRRGYRRLTTEEKANFFRSMIAGLKRDLAEAKAAGLDTTELRREIAEGKAASAGILRGDPTPEPVPCTPEEIAKLRATRNRAAPTVRKLAAAFRALRRDGYLAKANWLCCPPCCFAAANRRGTRGRSQR